MFGTYLYEGKHYEMIPAKGENHGLKVGDLVFVKKTDGRKVEQVTRVKRVIDEMVWLTEEVRYREELGGQDLLDLEDHDRDEAYRLVAYAPRTIEIHYDRGKEASDPVNQPSHYTTGRVEVIEMIEDITGGYDDGYVGYCVGNAIKYLARAPHKHDHPDEDLQKAKKYLEFALERLNDMTDM